MRLLLLIILSLFLFCSPTEQLEGQITWDDVVGTTWYISEELNIVQSAIHYYQFNTDTIYLTTVYYDNETLEPESYSYMKGKVYNKRYEEDHVGDIDLFYTWARKHYADPQFQVSVESYNIVDDWFIYKIDENDHLLMGAVTPPNTCYHWEFTRKI